LSAVGSVVQRGGCGAPGAADRRHARLIRAPLRPISQLRSARRARPLKRTALLAKPVNGINAPQRPDYVAGHVGLELRNVDPNYLLERSHRFAGIQPNSGLGDYSRSTGLIPRELKCPAPRAIDQAGCRWKWRALMARPNKLKIGRSFFGTRCRSTAPPRNLEFCAPRRGRTSWN
jgi:hypothetical protein